MAQIIEFPNNNKHLSGPSAKTEGSVRSYETLWERACAKADEDQDGILALLNFMEEEPLDPEARRSFNDFLFGQLFDAKVPLTKRESLAAGMAALFMGPEHNKILLPSLVLGTKEERVVACIAIGFSGNKAALKPLRTAIWDEDAEVQKAAAFGLSGLKDGLLDEELVGILKNRLENCRCDDVRAAILVDLKLFACPALEPLFLKHSYDEAPEVQITALGGLLFHCSEAGLERAVGLLKSDRSTIRATALSVLERHGSRKYLKDIFPFLRDENARVRDLARDALEILREKVPNSVGWVS